MRPPRSQLRLLAVAVALAGSRAGAAQAQNAARTPEGLSTLDLAVAAGAAAGGIFLLAAGSTILSPPSPGMGTPAPDSLDARMSRRLYRGGGGRFLGGAPDLLGISLIPVLPAVVYGAGWLTAGPEEGVLSAQRLVAYVEAVGWSYLATGIVKYLVGRPRPYTEGANNHPELRKKPSEDNLSFFSGHASSSFAMGAFATRDFARFLQGTSLARSGPVAGALWGYVFPYAVGYGVPTLVAVSRVIDQQHWPSDVLTGALIGGLIGHLGYTAHFDRDGQPRARALPLVTTDGLGGRVVQLALVGRF